MKVREEKTASSCEPGGSLTATWRYASHASKRNLRGTCCPSYDAFVSHARRGTGGDTGTIDRFPIKSEPGLSPLRLVDFVAGDGCFPPPRAFDGSSQ
ncbi:hypothetical protein MRX96_004092 [Rhipicephalus microplus]